MALLPPELLLETFSFLSYYDLKKCEGVSWAWSTLIANDSRLQYLLFKSRTCADTPDSTETLPDGKSSALLTLPGHLPHPVFSRLTYRFGDTIEDVIIDTTSNNSIQITNLGIAEEFVCIPPVSEMTITVHRRREECSPLALSNPITCRVENKQGIRVLDVLQSLVDEGRKRCNLMSLFGGSMLCARLHAGQRPGLCMKADLLGKQRMFHSLNFMFESDSSIVSAVVETAAPA